MKKVVLFSAAVLVMLLTGCLKDDGQDTIVLMGSEAYVKPIEGVISDTLLSFIADTSAMSGEVIELPTGSTPPDIQGEYMLFLRELYAHNGHHPVANDTLFFRFGGDCDSTGCYPKGQHNQWVQCDIRVKGFSQQHVDSAYVMGHGNDFAAYFTVPYDDQYEPMSGVYFTLTCGYIITGTVTDTTIEQVKVACVNLSAEPNTPSQFVSFDAFVDRIYLYRVRTGNPAHPFGAAVRRQWYGL